MSESLEPEELEAESKEDTNHFYRRLGEICFIASTHDSEAAGQGHTSCLVASAPSVGLIALADKQGS